MHDRYLDVECRDVDIGTGEVRVAIFSGRWRKWWLLEMGRRGVELDPAPPVKRWEESAHEPHRRCGELAAKIQTSSMRAIGALSPVRGPSLMIRV